ncbi:MAG: hypothetical protein R3E39_11205 [Anaerolineae bacterium]
MPRLSVWMVRSALLHLGVGLTIGALLLWNKGLPFDAWLWLLRDTHINLLLVGWTLQFALGMMVWVMPRFTAAPRYGNLRLGWWGWGLLNGGVLLAAGGVWLGSMCTFAGYVAQAAAFVLFLFLIWRRIKPFAT